MEENRTGLYIALTLVLILLLVSALFLFWMLFHTDEKDSAPPKDEIVEIDAEPELPKAPEKPAASDEPYQPPELLEDEPVGNLDGNLDEHLYGTLRLFYDTGALTADTEDPKNRVTLLTKSGDSLPRLDAQVLNGPGLSESERLRLAVGLLQAYYTDPPETEAVSVSPDGESGYLLESPVVGETPAMLARVRFLPTGAKLWYVILLYPKGTMPDDALVTAFEGASTV